MMGGRIKNMKQLIVKKKLLSKNHAEIKMK